MIFEIAVGDAYGAAFEFAPKDYIEANNDGKGYKERQTKKGVRPAGQYTDDTQMTLAVAEFLLSNPNDYRPHQFAASFLTAYKRDLPHSPRPGFGSRIRLALTNSFSAFEFMANLAEPHQSSNGAVMRCLPCGILPTPEQVQNAAMSQAVATHIHHEAADTARVFALLVHSLLYNDFELDVPAGSTPFRLHVNWAFSIAGIRPHRMLGAHEQYDGVPCDSYATFGAVVDVVAASSTYRDVLTKSVALGGDVDSVAALAMGIASLCNHITKRMPAKFRNDLENGTFGRDYCKKIDEKIDRYVEVVRKAKEEDAKTEQEII